MPSFEFCAFRFLTQWQEDECALHNVIAVVPTIKAIRDALSYFQVARNFAGLKQPENAEFILTSLTTVRTSRVLSGPNDKVTTLAKAFNERFNRYNLSAASKLLWLSCRAPYIIYDTRAVNALIGTFGHNIAERDYPGYSQVWREEYERHEAAIQAAVEQLPKGRLFMRPWAVSDQELVRMAEETWFMERVFDIFLWEVGGSDNA